MTKKLLCLIFGHQPVKVIDKADWNLSTFGIYADVIRSHRECYRCKKEL